MDNYLDLNFKDFVIGLSSEDRKRLVTLVSLYEASVLFPMTIYRKQLMTLGNNFFRDKISENVETFFRHFTKHTENDRVLLLNFLNHYVRLIFHTLIDKEFTYIKIQHISTYYTPKYQLKLTFAVFNRV